MVPRILLQIWMPANVGTVCAMLARVQTTPRKSRLWPSGFDAVAAVLTTAAVASCAFMFLTQLQLGTESPGTVVGLGVVGTALCTATAVYLSLRFLQGASPPPNPAPEVATEITETERRHQRQDIYARWLIRVRWIGLATIAAILCLTVSTLQLLPRELLRPLAVVLLAVALLNTLHAFLLERSRLVRVHVLELQIYLDLLAVTALLHYTGGVENPVFVMLVIPVMIAGITLSKLRCYAVAVSAGLLFTALLWAEASGVLAHFPLQIVHEGDGDELHAALHDNYVFLAGGGMWITLLVTAGFIARMAEHVGAHENELRRIMQHAVSEHRLLENALSNAHTGIRVLDEQLEERWSNELWQNWFGTRAVENDGASAALTLGTPKHAELEKSGKTFHVTSAPLQDASGEIHEVVQLAQDVTAANREREESTRAMRLAAIGKLASHVAHEVNNPVTILIAKARLSLTNHSEDLPAKVRVDLEKIVGLGDRIARTANSLLGHARHSTDHREWIDPRVPLQAAVDLVRQKMSDTNIELHESCDEVVPLVHANSGELEQVCLNILLNGIDAMEGDGRLSVSVRHKTATEEGRSYVCLEVVDSGCGIVKSDQQYIFDPFFTTKTRGNGTGLGLSICHGIIESHGGHIEVDSEEGRGTRMTIRLPPHGSESKEPGVSDA